MASRNNKGRQRLEMKKISKESNLLVTFSKRRNGVFKKASELCTLCGVETAILVFSPGKNKVYSFGHPNVKHVINKFQRAQNPNSASGSGVLQPAEPHLVEHTHQTELDSGSGVLQPTGGQLVQLTHLTELDDQLETQMAYAEGIAAEKKQREANDWFRAPVEVLSEEQLETLKSGFEELLSSVADRINNLALTPQPQNLTSSDLVGGEALDDYGRSLGIKMTPDGYSMC